MAQSRYRQTPLLTQVKFKSDQNQAEVFFSKPVRAITPGQSLVLYDQDVVVGSGVISI
jgi:tRNA-specific 2-thiouridylase